jgi:hypothetical protein
MAQVQSLMAFLTLADSEQKGGEEQRAGGRYFSFAKLFYFKLSLLTFFIMEISFLS